MTIKELNKLINLKSPKKDMSLSRIFIGQPGRLQMAIEWHREYKSLVTTIQMDYKGKVLDLDARGKSLHFFSQKTIDKILASTIDLSSFPLEYQKNVYESYMSTTGGIDVVGVISKTGKYIPYSLDNIDKVVFPTHYTSRRGKQEELKNYHLAKMFKNFVKEHKQDIELFSIDDKAYRAELKLYGIDVLVILEKMFNYKLLIRIVHPALPTLDLRDDDYIHLDESLKEIKSGRINYLNQVKMVTQTYEVESFKYEPLSPTKVKATIQFDGRRGRPAGEYEFLFDFEKKEVKFLTTTGPVAFLQEKVEFYQDRLSRI